LVIINPVGIHETLDLSTHRYYIITTFEVPDNGELWRHIVPYEYLDHQADLGIRGIGTTLQEAFSQGAQAMLAAMADLRTVRPQRAVRQRCSAPDIPSLFVEWLNELLYQREVNGWLFASAQVTRLERDNEAWILEGMAYGEPIDVDRHEIYTEVKAATYGGLEYQQRAGQHIIQCIIDL
jgi:SHS2 domain-containing protein